mmetsp:Transcript_3566/g.5540  ORF Transcript_3566/g.5540 Transcript_3566/m.5540 type:complete len:300 (+) Transcript_3566:108-1007(+)
MALFESCVGRPSYGCHASLARPDADEDEDYDEVLSLEADEESSEDVEMEAFQFVHLACNFARTVLDQGIELEVQQFTEEFRETGSFVGQDEETAEPCAPWQLQASVGEAWLTPRSSEGPLSKLQDEQSPPESRVKKPIRHGRRVIGGVVRKPKLSEEFLMTTHTSSSRDGEPMWTMVGSPAGSLRRRAKEFRIGSDDSGFEESAISSKGMSHSFSAMALDLGGQVAGGPLSSRSTTSMGSRSSSVGALQAIKASKSGKQAGLLPHLTKQSSSGNWSIGHAASVSTLRPTRAWAPTMSLG